MHDTNLPPRIFRRMTRVGKIFLGLLVMSALLSPATALAQKKKKEAQTEIQQEAQATGQATDEAFPMPTREEMEPWIGDYKIGYESISLYLEGDQLAAKLGPFNCPIDGEWHHMTEPYKVSYRLAWEPKRGVFKLEEKHSEKIHWRYELRLDPKAQRLLKFEQLAGGGDWVMVRALERQGKAPSGS